MNPKWSKRFQLKQGRWVYVPTQETTTTGKQIKRQIEGIWKPPPYYFHLRRGGHVQALRSHVGNSVFVRLDVRNFFGSISRSRVTRSLATRFGYKTGREWANASTVFERETKRSIVPFGFVQSPIVASLCFYDSALGRYLAKLRKNKNFALSVYVDDLIISCKEPYTTEMHDVVLVALRAAAHRALFELSEKKTQGPAPNITAFNIDLGHGSMRVGEVRLNEFLIAIEKSHSEFERFGIVGYVSSVNAEQGEEVARAGSATIMSPES